VEVLVPTALLPSVPAEAVAPVKAKLAMVSVVAKALLTLGSVEANYRGSVVGTGGNVRDERLVLRRTAVPGVPEPLIASFRFWILGGGVSAN
jgi:hypothetical protein